MRPPASLIALLLTSSASAQEKPPIPYNDWGACPFECCTYREWETTKQLNVHAKRSVHSPVAFHLAEHQKVVGVTGVVVTLQYGVTHVLMPIAVGYTANGDAPQLSLKPGDVLYTLHYLGEGQDLFWYRGKTYSDQVSVPTDTSGNIPTGSKLRDESQPKTEWWVKVKATNGRTGWSNETGSFAHMDRCE